MLAPVFEIQHPDEKRITNSSNNEEIILVLLIISVFGLNGLSETNVRNSTSEILQIGKGFVCQA